MAIEIEVFPRQMPPGGPPAAAAAPQPKKPLSASFAEMMARAEAGDTAAPTGAKPLSANHAELMAAADGRAEAAREAAAPRVQDLEPRQRSLKTARGHGGGIDFRPFGEDGLTFGDIIDVINPLQHIPIIGTIYRWLTGDEISPVSSLAGGFLFGGPIGLAASAVNVIVDQATGDDIGGNVMTAMFGESPAADGGGFNPDIDFAGSADERRWSVAEAPAAAGKRDGFDPRFDFAGASQSRNWRVAHAAPAAAAAPQVAAVSGSAATMPQATALALARPVAPATGPEERAAAASSTMPVTLSEDQLVALLAKGEQRTLNPLPPPGAPAKTPRPAVAAAVAPADAAAGSAAMPARVLSAMDKYEAMLKARAAATVPDAAAPSGAIRVSA
jgi:hypothetical protein